MRLVKEYEQDEVRPVKERVCEPDVGGGSKSIIQLRWRKIAVIMKIG